MPDTFARRSRLVHLGYSVINQMDPPPPALSDREILTAMAAAALKAAVAADGPPKLPPPQKPRMPAFLRWHDKPEDGGQ